MVHYLEYNGPYQDKYRISMKKFKYDLKTALWLATVIGGLVAAILSSGVVAFVISLIIMSGCAYVNNDIHDKLFNSDEHV